MEKEIKITCECQHSLTIEQLQAFQGKLKSIDSESFDKLKASIVKYGFSFPIFVWNDQILDGHQRLAAIKKLIEDGYTLKADLLPVVPIQAKDRKEAAEKLLLINSRYAKIDQEGFDFFVQDFDIDVADMSGLLEIPEISLIPMGEGESDYESEWEGMPEFDNEDKTSYRKLIVHFYSEDDFKKFCGIIDQDLTESTKSIDFPKRERADLKSLEYET